MIVQRAALAAISEAASMGTIGALPGRFRELLGQDPDVTSRLDATTLDACFDLDHHLRHAPDDPRARARRRPMTDHRRPTLHAPARRTRSTTRRGRRSAAARCRATTARSATASSTRERGERIIVVTDRLSAFDAVVGTIPFKGQVLNQLAQFWFEQTGDLAPNHMLRVPDPNVMVARECEPLPVELVMRAYLTGVTSTSIWKAYEEGDAHVLRPRAARRHEEEPAAAEADPDAVDEGREGRSRRLGLARTSCSRWAASTRRCSSARPTIAEALFAAGQAHAAKQGLILADTKYEMGARARRHASS